MNDLRIKVIGLCVSALVLAVVFMYVIQFGYHFSTEHDDWGTFGDYFGGVLNPLVAVFGFLGVLHSLHLQRQQLSQLVVDRKGEEVLAAIKDLDAQISERLKISIGFSFSAIGEKVELTIAHMVSEATRCGGVLSKSDSYAKFVMEARLAGTTVEAPVSELRSFVVLMSHLVGHHPSQEMGEYSPIIFYYANKASRLLPMLKDIGGLSEECVGFFGQERWTSQ